MTAIEIATLTNDSQARNMLTHIVHNATKHILVQGGPGFGKTMLDVFLNMLYGWPNIKSSTFAADLVQNMVGRGIMDCATFHSMAMSALMSLVRRLNKLTLLTKEQSVARESERLLKAAGILYTMYPPVGMETTPQALDATTNVENEGSIIYRIYGAALTRMMDNAHTYRFGLPNIMGPLNAVTGQQGAMPAGPDIDDDAAWERLAEDFFVDKTLIDMVGKMEGSSLQELYDHLDAKYDMDSNNLHELLVKELVELCPLLYRNMFDFFDKGRIVMPDGTFASTIWMHHPKTGAVLYLHRSLITYMEMMYLAIRYNAKILTEYKALFFVDEFNDLTRLQLHLLLCVYKDAKMTSWLCSKPVTQFVFAGDCRQGIYAFQGAMHRPLNTIKAAFAIDANDVLIGDGTHRNPESHITYLEDKLINVYPDVFTDEEGELLTMHCLVPGHIGTVIEKANADALDMPPVVDMSNNQVAATAKIIFALARNQKDVADFVLDRIGTYHEDWQIDTTFFKTTTRDMMLSQLNFFRRNHMTTINQMKVWMELHDHVDAYRARRKCFWYVVQETLAAGTVLDSDLNGLAAVEAKIKSMFGVKPSYMGMTMHASKGKQCWGSLIIKHDQVPSSRAISTQHSHPAIFDADVKLKFVALTRASEVMWILETDDERELRLNDDVHSEDGDDAANGMADDSQSSSINDMVAPHTPEQTVTHTAEDALQVLELTDMPNNMNTFTTYVRTKRKAIEMADPIDTSENEMTMDGDLAKLAAFDAAVKVVRKAMLFTPPTAPRTTSCFALSLSNATASAQGSNNDEAGGSNDPIQQPQFGDAASVHGEDEEEDRSHNNAPALEKVGDEDEDV